MAMTSIEASSRIELEIGGMTCASCAARVEKKLNELDGRDGERQLRDRAWRRSRTTRIRFAWPTSCVRWRPPVTRPRLPSDAEAKTDLVRPLRNRLLVSAGPDGSAAGAVDGVAAAVRRLGVARVCARDADRALGRIAFHRAAVLNARHRTATMDTLISIGTLAAWGWSVGRSRRGAERRRLLRGRRRDHDADPARPLSRGAGSQALRRSDSRAARARSQGGTRPPRRL